MFLSQSAASSYSRQRLRARDVKLFAVSAPFPKRKPDSVRHSAKHTGEVQRNVFRRICRLWARAELSWVARGVQGAPSGGAAPASLAISGQSTPSSSQPPACCVERDMHRHLIYNSVAVCEREGERWAGRAVSLLQQQHHSACSSSRQGTEATARGDSGSLTSAIGGHHTCRHSTQREGTVLVEIGFSESKCCADSLSVCPTPVCVHTHENVRTLKIL